MKTNETEKQVRLRRAKEAVAACRDAENEARKALAAAIESTRKANEKYNELFLAEENAQRKLMRDQYNHYTA